MELLAAAASLFMPKHKAQSLAHLEGSRQKILTNKLYKSKLKESI